MIKKIIILLFFCCAFIAKSQINSEPQMADTFRDNGKIYVVITVIAMIFAALILFLIYLERKVKKLEEQIKNN